MNKDKFLFYSKSASKLPGKGSGEFTDNKTEYTELIGIKNWRQMLSNFYISPFVLDDERWNSVEHFFHASKFRDEKKPDNNYKFYKTFTIKSKSPWSLNPVNSKQAGKAGRISKVTVKVTGKVTEKIYTRKIDDTKIPTDVSMRHDFYSSKIDDRVQTIGFFAKFTQNEELKNMLLATKDAELWHHVGRGAPNQLWTHLMRVRECIRKFDKIYDLKNISKFSTKIVTEILKNKKLAKGISFVKKENI